MNKKYTLSSACGTSKAKYLGNVSKNVSVFTKEDCVVFTSLIKGLSGYIGLPASHAQQSFCKHEKEGGNIQGENPNVSYFFFLPHSDGKIRYPRHLKQCRLMTSFKKPQQ